MDTRYLEYILILAETGNMTRAADKLFISQPTLSQFLSKQEQEIGAPLFQRINGIYTLTPIGNLYAEYARKVLSLTSMLEKDVKRLSTASRISIGTSSSRALQMVTSILIDFRKYYPRVEIALNSCNLRTMRESMSKGTVDIAFVTTDSLNSPLTQNTELKKEEIVFAVSSSHPYCQSLPPGKHSLTSQELIEIFGNTPFILQLKGSCIRYLVDKFWGKDFSPLLACSTSHAQTIWDMVANNIGVGFIPAGYASPSPLITYFSLKPKLYRIHAILFRKDLSAEAPHKYLVELAMNYVKENWNTF
ncbi:MAG TPA: LysR family transcriptional regulator [Candidatus Cottocaccamicrobium excrementipullorum]|nr:LysR family transcriptional regulator [Candidatus Cottocaccamicrobium excrementipullorum]